MIRGKTVTEITVTDPDSGQPVDVSIIKLETGGMIGIDSSFLSETDEPVYSPFDRGEPLEIDGEPPDHEEPFRALLVTGGDDMPRVILVPEGVMSEDGMKPIHDIASRCGQRVRNLIPDYCENLDAVEQLIGEISG